MPIIKKELKKDISKKWLLKLYINMINIGLLYFNLSTPSQIFKTTLRKFCLINLIYFLSIVTISWFILTKKLIFILFKRFSTETKIIYVTLNKKNIILSKKDTIFYYMICLKKICIKNKYIKAIKNWL